MTSSSTLDCAHLRKRIDSESEAGNKIRVTARCLLCGKRLSWYREEAADGSKKKYGKGASDNAFYH